jgi:hypothetical protein
LVVVTVALLSTGESARATFVNNVKLTEPISKSPIAMSIAPPRTLKVAEAMLVRSIDESRVPLARMSGSCHSFSVELEAMTRQRSWWWLALLSGIAGGDRTYVGGEESHKDESNRLRTG